MSNRRTADVADVLADGAGIIAIANDAAPVVRTAKQVKPAPPFAGTLPPAPPKPPALLVADAATAEWVKPQPIGIPTGFPTLDDKLCGGFMPESVYVLSAPMGRGKSGMAIQIARYTARRGLPVLYLTSELTMRQMVARIAAQETARRWLDLWKLGPEDSDAVRAPLDGLPLRVARVRTPEEAVDEMKRAADAFGAAPLIVVDYLQRLARQVSGNEDRRLVVARASDLLVEWSISSRSPVLAVSSTGRANYAADPTRSARDFANAAKESGDVDYDAAGLFFLETEECPADGSAPGRLHISKNRHGTEGTIGFQFSGAIGTFEEDASAALTGELQQAYAAIRDGATTVAAVREAMGCKGEKATGYVVALEKRRLIAPRATPKSPLRLRTAA